MRRLTILLAAVAVTATTAFAADNPIESRQKLMDANGAAAGVSGGIMKDEIAYVPAVGKAAIETFNAVSHSFGAFFPEGSNDPANSSASPKIWEDAAGFQAELDKFIAATTAASAAAGKAGPADKAAFVAAVQPVLGTCKSCHEGYRIQK